MDRDELRALLADVAAGRAQVDEALSRVSDLPLSGRGYEDLGFARVDHHRGLRTGDPEVVYGEGKTPDQVVAIVRSLRTAGPTHPVLVTRADDECRALVAAELGGEVTVEEQARCVVVGDLPEPRGRVVVVSAGTSDGPVAAEAALTARVAGAGVTRLDDCGVAGLHRLLDVRGQLDNADCLVVVAGMEGALPSVVGGLVGTPLVAVPTSVGYGASYRGLAALLAMLNSCAPGVAVVNVDNGFGAGLFAARIARRAAAAHGGAGQ